MTSRNAVILGCELVWLAASGAALVRLSHVLTEAPRNQTGEVELLPRAYLWQAGFRIASARQTALQESRQFHMLNCAIGRVRDVTLAAIGLVFTLPLMLIIAISIKCDSPRPGFFLQDRVGKNGRRFKMVKFRSMYTEQAEGKQIYMDSHPEWITSRRHPHITRVGALTRGFHLDELPQLINVLKGDMSIVCPRPFHPLHNAHLEKIPCFNLRLMALPGITGWAQVRCDYSDSVNNCEEVLARDLYYVKHANLVFDLMIIAETLRICIWRRGAR